ncbi:Der-p2-like allergen [Leptotrombidium deliense]|uniref:Der-p2-like allergen n=1 Tax=Leptotrombidium deliense TaxID=299467 RepID=A0A443SDN5_9ACAR|nr:Der-p2-like allergen [Leptotrombidium deliense]
MINCKMQFYVLRKDLCITAHNMHDVSKTRKGEIQTVSIDPCTSEPCTLKGGTTATITIVFVSNQDSNTATLGGCASMKVFLSTVTLMNFPTTNICDQVNCPIVAGNTYTVKYSVEVPSKNANNVEIKMTLSGDKGNTGCVKFIVNITK